MEIQCRRHARLGRPQRQTTKTVIRAETWAADHHQPHPAQGHCTGGGHQVVCASCGLRLPCSVVVRQQAAKVPELQDIVLVCMLKLEISSCPQRHLGTGTLWSSW